MKAVFQERIDQICQVPVTNKVKTEKLSFELTLKEKTEKLLFDLTLKEKTEIII